MAELDWIHDEFIDLRAHMDKRFDGLNGRLRDVEVTSGKHDTRITNIETNISDVETDLSHRPTTAVLFFKVFGAMVGLTGIVVAIVKLV